MLLSKKTRSPSAEELLATLQGQVQSLTVQNKELREKIQARSPLSVCLSLCSLSPSSRWPHGLSAGAGEL